ncbi:alpha/beta fold hydrolase [Actinomadura rudentiformis]|uniref:Alpha/beta hydrolase n=1 Tax=Actinomadura rudentiformis TaxID=359158 RepID=A0A6H9YPS9_9ACTN|nr:alpha/beta hydrolase [Actinomadura rudentiformis]KAB2342057.1 alpha/beta hydrolase [Actinomadura rudentiformis]
MTEYIEVSGGRIAYDVTGEGPLVILAPGMGDLRSTYRLLGPELVRAGYRVVTTDLRGHGESSTPFASYDNTSAGADLVALIRHLGGPAVIVGHSFSGGSAVWAAGEDASLVNGLVLVGAFTRPVSMNLFMTQLARLVLGFPALWGMYYKTLFKGPKPADFAEHLAAVKANMREKGRMAAAREMGLGTKTDMDGRLGRVTAPTLIMYGTKDPDFPDPEAEAGIVAGELAGKTETVMIEGAGHYPHQEFPAETAAAVLAFLGQVAPTTQGAA